MRVLLLRLLFEILFSKKYRPKKSNIIIFILPTDQPTLFFWLSCPQTKKLTWFRLIVRTFQIDSDTTKIAHSWSCLRIEMFSWIYIGLVITHLFAYESKNLTIIKYNSHRKINDLVKQGRWLSKIMFVAWWSH